MTCLILEILTMRELIDAESLKLIETGPTYHSEDRDTWIGLLLVDYSDVVLTSDRLSGVGMI